MKIAIRFVAPLAMVALLAAVATIGRSDEKPAATVAKVAAPATKAVPPANAGADDPAVARARKTYPLNR